MSLKKKTPQEETVTEEQKTFELVPPPDEDTTPVVSSERLGLATALVCRTFSIPEGFSVSKFNDKGKVVELTLDGDDFIVAVTIKNSETQPGMMSNT